MNFSSDLAPVVLFVYNRPWHTRQTLEALRKNELADRSELYIYADGPKANASPEDLQKVQDVRRVIREKDWCKSVKIVEHDQNLGLADSVITGVSEIVYRYGTVIVLEDDIVTTRKFLEFMNLTINKYKDNDQIMSLTGYMEPINVKGDDVVFLQKGSSWGWATWARAWHSDMFETEELHKRLLSIKDIDRFNFGGQGYIDMLKSQFEGEINSWAICYYTYGFLNNKLHVNPPRSLVKNIGFDGSGEHCGSEDTFEVNPEDYLPTFPPEVADSSEEVDALLTRFFRKKATSARFRSYLQKFKDLV